MSVPVDVPLSPAQDEMYQGLLAVRNGAQNDLNLFCATIFRGIGVKVVGNVQRLEGPDGPRLMGEAPDVV